ncbi:MAG TPA: DUF881 domain-containing protein [Candidatus Limnocylindrales bacterium]|nr:DUF881 domain-containing protein [Candidatus Limnocylindrales bacterium]
MTSLVRGRVPSWQITLGAALLVLGFLVAAQLRSETTVTRYASSELPTLRQTAQELQDTQDTLKAEIQDLRQRIQAAEQSGQGNGALVSSLNDSLEEARLDGGLVALEGPGLVIQLDDSTNPVAPGAAPGDYLVSATDLRTVVDQLWLAGAEAVAIGGERLVVTSALTDIGSSVLVNGSYLQAPYDISAIGPSDLWDRLVNAPGFVAFMQQRVATVGLSANLAQSQQVVVPAYNGSISLVQARPAPSPAPAPTAGTGAQP